MSEKIMTLKEWESLSAESRAAVNRYGVEHYELRERAEKAEAQVAALTAALEEANSALISMVYQYCYRPLDANKEPAIDIYQHDFMSAGEEAFAYLVEHGLAKWTDESHYAILINNKTSLSVKSDDLGKDGE